jgi:Domain of unknown function (DUF1707)
VLFRLFAWLVFALAQRRVALAGDIDRERAASRLREGYARGYLTLEEFSRRSQRALSARSRGDLRRALSGLSRPSLLESAHTAVHDVVVVVVSGAYVVFNLVLALVLAVTLLLGGASASTLVLFALAWLVPTYLYVRFRRR